MAINALYSLILIVFSVLSWGFVDPNSSLPSIPALQPVLYLQTIYPTAWYTFSIVTLFGWHAWTLHRVGKGLVGSKQVWHLIAATVLILMWAYPALSHDLFNYIATAKVTFLYRENPYIIMPIDLPNEPSFSFLHAANKVALYGPVWIALTGLPHILSFGNLFVALFTFKFFVIIWYVILCYLIWIASGKKPWPLAFFALNPLVVLSTVVDGHNDVVMMTLALVSLLFLKRRMIVTGATVLAASILIKGATIFLVPIFFWYWFAMLKKKSLQWNRMWYWASIAMYTIFFLSPLREEIYAWYFIWPLTFLAMTDNPSILHALSYGLSFGLSLRIVPFLYFRSWSGLTPLIKKIVTFVPAVLSTLFYGKTLQR